MNYIKKESGILVPESYFNTSPKNISNTEKWIKKEENFFWVERSQNGRVGMLLFLLLIAAMSWKISSNLLPGETDLVNFLCFSGIFFCMAELTIYIYKNIKISFFIAYGSLIVLATLCFIRISLILPETLKHINAEAVRLAALDKVPVEDVKLFLFIDSYLSSVPMLIVFFFIFIRITLWKFPLAIKFWNNTLICWGVFFTIFTTISSQWN